MSSRATIRVWDPVVRLFHWGLVASFAIAWISAEEWNDLHETAGYVAGGLIAVRLVWGLIGTRYARFWQFVRRPATVIGYLGDMLKGREARYIGHNPAGGAMVLALLACMAVLVATGWMGTLDAFWGVEWVEEVHETFANLLLALVGVHVLGVVWASLKHGESLVRAMVNGRKKAPEPGDVA
ncbi:cytochrome B [Rhodospirillaceae bacterium KN72]|uniref:Cytochrome B n=2 Tax=Pacificispira spongiicola TaxID=2729598 RepID=A0A7Y0HCM9_9PROT|nr:cytochrome B [Pacificispira spongiicola]